MQDSDVCAVFVLFMFGPVLAVKKNLRKSAQNPRNPLEKLLITPGE